MGDVNVLSGGIEILHEIKENLLELDGYKEKSLDMVNEQEKLEKLIAAREKARDSEIAATVSKRIEEVEESFDGQIEKTRARVKKVKAKRDKLKDTKVSERIDVETADMREEIRSLNQDIKALFTKNQIPRIFNTKYFFSMYMPGEFGDFITILFSIIIMLALPFGIYLLLPAELQKIWMIILLYLAVLSIGMGLFMLIFKKVRTKHIEPLHEARALRGKISRVKKRIRSLAKNIKKDKDESKYGLDKYDEEMAELDKQIDHIIAEKKNALTSFESQIKPDIVSEIKARYEGDLNRYRADYDKAYEEQKSADAKVNAFTLEISRKYEAYVGKEMLSISMIDSLIDIINSGDALTIADALICYKKLLAEEKNQ